MDMVTKTYLIRMLVLCMIVSIGFLLIPHSLHAATLSQPANQLGLVGYWAFDEGSGTQVGDSSGNKNSGTITGAIWVNGKYGPALYFDGDEDFITFSEIGLQNDAPTITLSVWFKIDNKSIPQGHRVLAAFSSATYLSLFSEGLARPFVSLRIGGSQKTLNSGFLPDTNTWHHMVATYDGNTMRIYVDGIERNVLGELSGGIGIDSIKYIGRYTSNPASTDYEFFGSMDDFRIYSRALSASEVRALYTQGQARLVTPNNLGLVGHWTFDEGSGTHVGDASSSRNHGTLTGGTSWTDGIRGKALYFDGIDGWINNITQPNIQTGPNVFTITGFMKPGNQDARFITPNSNGIDQWIGYNAGNRRLEVRIAESGDTHERSRFSSSSSVPLDRWTHFSVSINDKNIKIYINGVLNSEYDESIDIGNWSGAWRIGQRGNGTSWYLGALDDLRVYNKELTGEEIQRLYQSGAGTVNTSSVTRTQGTTLSDGLIGHWTFDGPDLTTTTAVDRSGQGNHGTLGNSPIPAIGKIGQGLIFNGANSFIEIPHASNHHPVDGLTMAAWVYPKSNGEGGAGRIIDKSENTSTNSGYALYISNTVTQGFQMRVGGSGGPVATPSSVFEYNEWTHVASTVQSDGSTTIYVNGSSVALGTTGVLTNITTAYPLCIGNLSSTTSCGTSRTFDGGLDDVRIYNRTLSAEEVKQLYNLGR